MKYTNKQSNLFLDHSWYYPLLKFATTRQQQVSGLLEKKYKKVLDLGCSSGDFLINNQHLFDSAIGLDINQVAIKTAITKSKHLSHLTFLSANLNDRLPNQSNKFDLVVSLSTIEYLLDPIKFLHEIYRVLKPKGILILHTHNLAFLLRRIQLLSGKLPTFNSHPGWQGNIIHEFTWPSLTKLISSTKLKIISKTCAGILPRAKMVWPNLLCADIIIKAHK